MPHRKLKAFVVEDDAILCRAFAETLEGDVNITAVEAHDLPDAVRLCRAEPQPVLLVDLGLPSADGVEAVSALRHELPGATLVVVTGAAEREEAAIAAGAHAVIHKGSVESYGSGLIDTVRRAVMAHDASLLFRASKDSMARREDILKRIGQALGTVLLVVGLGVTGSYIHATAAATLRADNEVMAQAEWSRSDTRGYGS